MIYYCTVTLLEALLLSIIWKKHAVEMTSSSSLKSSLYTVMYVYDYICVCVCVCVCVCIYSGHLLKVCASTDSSPFFFFFFTNLYALFGPHAPFGSTQW